MKSFLWASNLLACKGWGLCKRLIADIESGRSKPSLDTLEKLAKALDVYILELTDDSKPNYVNDARDNNTHTHDINTYQPKKTKDTLALTEANDPELAALCNDLLYRKDLQAMLRKMLKYKPETVQKLLDVIDLIEQEGQH